MRQKLRSVTGEMLVESLISLVIISLTGMMLAMAAASAMRGEAQAVQTTTFVNVNNVEDVQPYPAQNCPFTVSLTGTSDVPLGMVTVKKYKKLSAMNNGEEGLYYYEANS